MLRKAANFTGSEYFMNEDIDIGAELYDKIHADFLKQLGKERELRSMADVSGYSGQVGRALSRAMVCRPISCMTDCEPQPRRSAGRTALLQHRAEHS